MANKKIKVLVIDDSALVRQILVEIMKTFHEVHSDAAGRIARFLVENSALVDAGQDIIALESD